MQVGIGRAAGFWLGAWLVGNVVGSFVLVAVNGGSADDAPIWATVLGALLLWVPFLVALTWLSRTDGTGDPVADYGLRFEPIDLVGLVIGVLGQLVLIRLVYLPLEAIWPDTFSQDRLQENARDLWDRADGVWLVALVLVVVVGAPLVEELVYRGLLQGAMVRRLDDVLAVVVVAAWFAVIHFRPVEYPGLFAIGLVFGVCALVTRRLGMSVMAHLAFNAVGLALAAR
jgi:membrane protease YdiL (CAAX protease family)